MLHIGPEGLSDGELLAVLLRIGKAGQSAEDLGRQLLMKFNGIGGIDCAHIEDLLAVPGMGIAKAAQLKSAIEIGKEGPYAKCPATGIFSHLTKIPNFH